MVKLPEDEDTPEKRVKKIFRMMDKDENGSLDMEEFKVGHQQSSSSARMGVNADNLSRRAASATKQSCPRYHCTTAWCENNHLISHLAGEQQTNHMKPRRFCKETFSQGGEDAERKIPLEYALLTRAASRSEKKNPTIDRLLIPYLRRRLILAAIPLNPIHLFDLGLGGAVLTVLTALYPLTALHASVCQC